MPRKPVTNPAEYELKHMELDDMLRRYQVSPRGRDAFTPETKRWLSRRHSKSLKAINPVARIAFMRALHNRLEEAFQGEDAETAHFITIIPGRFSHPLQSADQFSTAKAKAWLRSVWGIGDYIGFWEAAYFYRSPFAESGNEPYVCWHVHMVAWNVDANQLAAAKRKANRAVDPFLPGVKPFDSVDYCLEDALGRAVYMSKGALSEYAAVPKKRQVTDTETGEIREVRTGRWRSRKRAIRPGNLVRATNAIGSRTLASLCVAGGQGVAIRRAAISEAAAELKRRNRLLEAEILRLTAPSTLRSKKETTS
ncbi:MAG: hypothetical protein ACK4UW_20445 [Rhizobium rhizophilum]|uniref:hypothetical protein n=1 Tax=Rhizobium rhizophilum TaxID=1850373 RepID=UPI00391999CF